MVIKLTKTTKTKAYLVNKVTKKKEFKITKTITTSYYISTTYKSAKEFNQKIRSHWSVEVHHNKRDTVLMEDKSRIRVSPGVFGRLRTIALNSLEYNQVKSISKTITQNGWDRLSKVVKVYGNLGL